MIRLRLSPWLPKQYSDAKRHHNGRWWGGWQGCERFTEAATGAALIDRPAPNGPSDLRGQADDHGP